MTGETHPEHHFCPPLRALDVFDHGSVPNAMAQAARAGFGAIPDCRVTSFILSGGKYRASMRFSPKGAPVSLTADTIAELVTTATDIAAATRQEAA